ncbi:MAG: arylamine N-acetyltransferase [Rhodospirillales bacterium]
MTADFDLAAYLGRIGLREAPKADLEGLTALHWAQLTAVPFENIDIALGRGIQVAPEAIFAKLVTAKRGGYCHECNGLLRQALEALGFETRALSARVLQNQEGIPPRSHTLTLVELGEERYLVDAGFGAQTPRRPIPLIPDAKVERGRMAWQLREDSRFGWRVEALDGSSPVALYAFDLARVYPIDIAVSNHWTASSPASLFTQGPLAVRHLEAGRATLVAGKVVRRGNGQSASYSLPSVTELLQALREEFGLDVQANARELAKLGEALEASRSRD